VLARGFTQIRECALEVVGETAHGLGFSVLPALDPSAQATLRLVGGAELIVDGRAAFPLDRMTHPLSVQGLRGSAKIEGIPLDISISRCTLLLVVGGIKIERKGVSA